MGYRGKLVEREAARDLRARGWTMDAISAELGVSKSSVSLWTRDVPFEARRRQYRPGSRSTHRQHVEKVRQIADLNEWGRVQVGRLAEREFLTAGIALYAGEGAKTDGAVCLPNSDPALLQFFCGWLRHFFDIDEGRLRARLYLHEGLDLDAAEAFWSEVTGIPRSQFGKAYRATPDPSIRHNKHEYGCARVSYSCVTTHRSIMGLVRALLSSTAVFRGGEIGITADC